MIDIKLESKGAQGNYKRGFTDIYFIICVQHVVLYWLYHDPEVAGQAGDRVVGGK